MRQVEISYIRKHVDRCDSTDKILTDKVSSGAQILSVGGPYPDGDTRLSNFKNIVENMRKLNNIL